jgi:histidine ammonia-lyase
MTALDLGDHPLTLDELARVARDPRVPIRLSDAALARVDRCRGLIEAVAENYRREVAKGAEGRPIQDYGVTTGFGEFKDIPIAPEDLERLQVNLLLSHAVGAGDSAHPDDPANYFPGEVVRAALAIRLNAFLRGHSGVRRELAAAVAAMLERGIVPLVPQKGSVGSSGDLCPLAHLFVTWLGEGRYYVARTPEELVAHAFDARAWKPASKMAADLGFAPPAPSCKEALGLINGATFSAALLALASHDAERLADSADGAGALSLEAVCGCARAFDPKVHAARGMAGQIAVAAHYRELLTGSTLLEAAGAVQDAYSLRCAPAVHGAARDTIAHVRRIAELEINAATDNPLFFPGADGEPHSETPWDAEFAANAPPGHRGIERISYSAGNFHGEPVAMAADLLSIAVAELANISERRCQLLLDQHHNRNLPANLAALPGVQSGLMIAQYTASALVSENKVLAHPAVVDSIPTAANIEDHVAMATHAARKARTILGNGQTVIAIELLCAAQAIDWRVGMNRDPRGKPERLPDAERWAAAKAEAEAFRAATAPDRRAALGAKLGRGTGEVYRQVRAIVPTVVEDRLIGEDIRRLRVWVAAR